MKTTYYVEKMPYFSLNPSHKHPNHQFPLYLHLDNILPVAPYYIKQQTKQRSFVQTTFLLVFLCCVFLFSLSFTSLFFAHSKKKQRNQEMCVCVCSYIFFNSRHEVPVTSQPITIVYMDDDIVVVNKPASIPVSGLSDCHYFLYVILYISYDDMISICCWCCHVAFRYLS